MKKLEWSQNEYLKNKKMYEKQGIQTLLIDTINLPIDGMETILYNPYELNSYPEGTIFVFYCDTGKSTMERLEEFQQKFPDKKCVSLRGGRGYWRRTCSI